MKHRRPWIRALALWICVLCLPISPALAASDREEALNAVRALLDETYTAYVSLPKNLKFSRTTDSDSLYRYTSYVRSNIDHMRVHGLEYQEYNFQLWNTSVSLSGSTARVNTKVNLDYRYRFAPNTNSGIHNMSWSLGLTKSGGVWKVSSLDISGLNCFSSFRDKVDARKAKIKDYRTNVDQVVQLRYEQTRAIREGLEGMKRSAAVADAKPKAGQIAYDRAKAVRYAERFSIRAPGNRLFNTIDDGDCTVFVSCVLWAGYGGWKESGAGNQALITSKYRMTSAWYGTIPGRGYGSPSWRGVVELWNYIVNDSHSIGPVAKGINNNAAYTKLTQALQAGDVIQFYKYKKGRYGHSMVITKPTNDPYMANAARVLVCGHTGDTLNRSLVDILFNYDGLYGETPKTRLIVPQPAKFTS